MNAKEVVGFAKSKNIEMVDLKFMDFIGTWQHFAVPIYELKEDSFEEGFGFDGSSIRGWQPIHASDMLVIPDPETAVVDPFIARPTLSLICNIVDPITKENYSRDPRNIARKAEAYLKSTGIADTAFFGPEAEFFIFDDIRYGGGSNSGFFYIDSDEGTWNTGREEKPNLGYKPRHKEGYFPVPPTDSQHDLRDEMVRVMEQVGLKIEAQHHEVATAGQAEIDMRYSTLTKMADHLMMLKYVIKNVARKHNKVATYMPKPLFGDNGSGMHTHQSLTKQGTNLFFDKNGYALISQMCKWYIGGLIKHAPAILAFAAPTTNSYKRLVPGYEAPVNLAYSARNRSAICRIPVYVDYPKSKRVEFRAPDPTCNPYTTFAAMLMAGLDGIQNRLDPGRPVDENIYEMEASRAPKQVPGSLDESLGALERDHAFLLKGDVFTKDVIDVWLEYKRQEIDKVRLRPHPYEFYLYFDA